MKFFKRKCDYYGCKGKATEKIPTTFQGKPYTLKVCKKCYREYEAIMNE